MPVNWAITDTERDTLKKNFKELQKYAAEKMPVRHTESEKLHNMSIKEIIDETTKNAKDILNEFREQRPTDIVSILTILTKEERLIYVGIILGLVALSMYLL